MRVQVVHVTRLVILKARLHGAIFGLSTQKNKLTRDNEGVLFAGNRVLVSVSLSIFGMDLTALVFRL